MSAHTPGPWFYNAYRSTIGQQNPALKNSPQAKTVARLACDRLFATTEADARLIAVAPELLSLLKKYHDMIPTPESTELIAKAEGRE